MRRPEWVAPDVDLTRPSAARMYDFYLGGSHNFAADRDAAREVIAVLPDTPLVARANRAFLGRVVRYLVGAGIRQFLDIGSGIPTVGNVHEIAQGLHPDAAVAYVDLDPVAVAHSRQLLAGTPRTVVIQADLREPWAILTDPALAAVLDLDRPVAVLLMAVLHFVSEEDRPADILTTLRQAVAPGSYLAVSHGTDEGRPEQVAAMRAVYRRGGTAVTARNRAQVAGLLRGLDLVHPGVVWVPEWHPDPADDTTAPQRSGLIGAVARRP